jgi:hypothetical protein
MLITYWLSYALGVFSLVVLMAWELRQDLPLPFMDHMAIKDFCKTFLVGLALSFAIMVFGGIATIFLGGIISLQLAGSNALFSVFYYELARSANAGITEESFKVAFTNLFAIRILRELCGRRLERLKKVILRVIGYALVAIWAWLHVYYHNLPIRLAPVVFVVGIMYLELIIRKRNYLPVIFAHMTYNELVILLSFLSFYSFSPIV